jgi:secondary thiamine-phosphate synthase enzyme
MSVKSLSLSFNTRGNGEVIDITDQVADCVAGTGLKDGIVTIFCPSSTSGITTLEYEPGAVSDLKRLFDEIIPIDRPYAHQAAWNDYNGHSHVRSALLKPSLVVPFMDGHLALGTWQQIVYLDFDIRGRSRQLIVQVMGE